MTHINAFIEEAKNSIEAAKAAVRDAESALQAVIDKNRGNEPIEEPADGPSLSSEGEEDSKSKKVKYK